MFDHGGVLDGEIVLESGSVSSSDLVLEEYDWGGFQVLRNGIAIIEILNTLVKSYGYEIVFHSKNLEKDQMKILEQLQTACKDKQLNFPNIRAMAVFDQSLYGTKTSNDPETTTTSIQNIQMAGWGADDLDGKASVRRALEKLLEIKTDERKNHIVFDDGEPNVSTPRGEGYQAFLIGTGEGRVTLYSALQQVLLMNSNEVVEQYRNIPREKSYQTSLHSQNKPSDVKLNYILKKLCLNDIDTNLIIAFNLPDHEIVKMAYDASDDTQLKKIKILCAQYLGHTWEVLQDNLSPYSEAELRKKELVVSQLYHAQNTQQARGILSNSLDLLGKNRTPWSILILKIVGVIMTLPISLPTLCIYSSLKRGSYNFFKPDSQILSEKISLELSKS